MANLASQLILHLISLLLRSAPTHLPDRDRPGFLFTQTSVTGFQQTLPLHFR